MGMILRIASSRIVGQGDIVGRSGYFSLNLSANSVMRGRLDARRTLKSLVADLRVKQTWKPQTTSTIPNLEEVERQAIETAILQNNGNLTAAAEQLGISRQTLYNKLKRFKL